MSLTKLTLIVPEEEFDVLMDNQKDDPYSVSGSEIYVANRIPEKDMLSENWLDYEGSEVAIQVTIEKVLRRTSVPKLQEVKI